MMAGCLGNTAAACAARWLPPRRTMRGGRPRSSASRPPAAPQATGGTDVLSKTTVGEDLHAWLKRRRTWPVPPGTARNLARTTRHGYEEPVKLSPEPHLGHLKQRDLKIRHVEAMDEATYHAIERENAEQLLHHAKVIELEQARDADCPAWARALLCVENHSNRYAEDRRPCLALPRFFLARPAGQSMDRFQLPASWLSGRRTLARTARPRPRRRVKAPPTEARTSYCVPQLDQRPEFVLPIMKP